MARWSVSQPRGVGARGLCAPPPTGSSASPASQTHPALRARSPTLNLALPGLAAVLEHNCVGEAGDRGPVVPSRLPALLALTLEAWAAVSSSRIRDLIRQMNNANPLWGAPRIHGELLKLGIKVSQATVAKYMVRRVGRPSPAWRSFLRNQAAGIAAIDMFVVVSASFQLLYRDDHFGSRSQEDCAV
jgi:hypothetical protein